jgi:hypothetical protein
LDPALEFTSIWSIGEEAFSAVCADAGQLSPRTIVEFGSGVSSVRLALAFPAAEVFSIDDSTQFGGATQTLAERHGLTEQVHVSIRPLTWQWHRGALYQSYAAGPFPDQIDVVVIDGPPSSTQRGREACLHHVVGALRAGGRVYLDDYGRAGERQIVKNWLTAFPGVFQKWVLPFGHEVCVLEKTTPAAKARVDPRVFADVMLANARRGVAWAKRSVQSTSLRK